MRSWKYRFDSPLVPASISQLGLKFSFCTALHCVYLSFASSSIIFTFSLSIPYQTLSLGHPLLSTPLVHRAPSYLLVLHGSIAVPSTHLYSTPLGVRLYQVAAHAPFVASFLSFVFGVVHCTVLATSRCNTVSVHSLLFSYAILFPPVVPSHSVIPSHSVTSHLPSILPFVSVCSVSSFHLSILGSDCSGFWLRSLFWLHSCFSHNPYHSDSVVIRLFIVFLLLLFYDPFRPYCSVPYIFWQAVVVSLQLENQQLVFNPIPSFRTHSIFPYLFRLSALFPSSTSVTLS